MKSDANLALERHLGHFDALYLADGDPWRARSSWTERHKRMAIEKALGTRKLARGVELGCGNGITTRGLARHFQSLVAIEGSATAAALARAEVHDLRHVQIVEAFLPLPLPRKSCDAVVASEILYYLPQAALGEVLDMAYNALKPGGCFVSANQVGRFSDSECSLARISIMTRQLFGFEDYSLSWGPWRVDRFRRSVVL